MTASEAAAARRDGGRSGRGGWRAALEPRSCSASRARCRSTGLFAYDVRASTRARPHARRGRACSTPPTPRRSADALAGSSRRRADAPDEDVHSYLERRLVEQLGPAAAACTRDARATTRWPSRRASGPGTRYRRSRAASAAAAGAGRRGGGETGRSSCRATRTCSGRSPSCSATTWPRTPGRSRATTSACAGAYDAADVSPLGAGALAGSSLPLDPAWTRRRARLPAAFANTIDAVSDRDFVCDLLYACALAFVHLSRLAEEVVIFTSQEFALAELDDRVAHGRAR